MRRNGEQHARKQYMRTLNCALKWFSFPQWMAFMLEATVASGHHRALHWVKQGAKIVLQFSHNEIFAHFLCSVWNGISYRDIRLFEKTCKLICTRKEWHYFLLFAHWRVILQIDANNFIIGFGKMIEIEVFRKPKHFIHNFFFLNQSILFI